ncbi:hypothetical protein R69927_02299 [Paraburkholderia domus]|uniref:DUF4148 domain-containing protein n=1 Tax=Paraburkholderia domus TaxID=2793075 RepID=A0A9N8MWL5_9BURK|nr:hypothetical protein [Paraburkholderia domus]MBK5049522.1 hypothetical protein [Burkholderia sp. R-70006]MBK5061915.1 hypothetical protein [Burkholderia sp. R-70199]MBK5087168.1 hypothetical protein [Burkholderia sp. R-69927]MBK5123523.1 hypothetical protein [Burkholderia sp. R-69980]MBK5166755.1 hypothetical protein [Burkholderia sp. R-70211]MBK5180897.1 hypothetical protein [Burkholderia sp. R-69749]MCI0148307.1 hypothetical protein [Paraburkholderia sediminicola]
MKTKLVVALLVALSASAATPAFASGYGPAPSYRPSIGAPASQRGQSAQTLAAERDDATGSQAAYGGVVSSQSEAGSRVAAPLRDNLYARH